MTINQLQSLLQECTVRINTINSSGTGFFVAQNLILTCAHVVNNKAPSNINVYWKKTGQTYLVEIDRIIVDPTLDLAILRLICESLDHPCVYFDKSVPRIDDRLYCFGYPQEYPDGDSVTFTYEGESFKGKILTLKLKESQANFGLSGSPLLNQRTGGVCGIINLSRNSNIAILSNS